MKLPIIQGIIDRRILVNFRVDPEILAGVLPAPFRPKLHQGYGIAGICLIRLRGVRPRFMPRLLGIGSENAAHRIAVEWDEGDRIVEGVFVQRRDSSSWLNVLTGGRIFPGIHHHARFTVRECETDYQIILKSDDGHTDLSVAAGIADRLPGGSIFGSLAEASAFFEAGSLGYSPAMKAMRYDGMELRCRRWNVEPLTVSAVRSSYFDNPSIFKPGSIEFDCALLMRKIDHEWHSRSDICCPAEDVREQ